MKLIEEIKSKAAKLNKRIVFPESTDIRVLKAAIYLDKHSICTPILIGDTHEIKKFSEVSGLSFPGHISIINPKLHPRFDEFTHWFYEKRKSKGLSEELARSTMSKELYFAAALVAYKEVDGCVSGAVNTTGD